TFSGIFLMPLFTFIRAVITTSDKCRQEGLPTCHPKTPSFCPHHHRPLPIACSAHWTPILKTSGSKKFRTTFRPSPPCVPVQLRQLRLLNAGCAVARSAKPKLSLSPLSVRHPLLRSSSQTCPCACPACVQRVTGSKP